MTSAHPQGQNKGRMRLQEILSILLMLAAAALLVINFIIAIPVAIAALITSVVTVKTVKERRALYIGAACASGLLCAVSIAMAFFLLADGPAEVTVTTIPVPENSN